MQYTQLVTTWLNQRQSLLVALYELCSHRPFFLKLNYIELQGALQEFGGQILDYLSLGHFKVYENFLNDSNEHWLSIAKLTESTHQILNLNERHRFHLNVTQLERDLDSLTVKLAKRFELEDKLISNLLFAKPQRKNRSSWIH
jgi:regulator of sigma D